MSLSAPLLDDELPGIRRSTAASVKSVSPAEGDQASIRLTDTGGDVYSSIEEVVDGRSTGASSGSSAWGDEQLRGISEGDGLGASWQQTSATTFLYMFAGTALPYAIGQQGWVWSVVIMCSLTLTSWWSGHLLTEVCRGVKKYSWPEIGAACFGKWGMIAIEVLQVFGFVMTGKQT